MPFVTLDGLEFCYERKGAGPPLLFVSGTGGDLRLKPRVQDGPLARHFDVLAYDQRGLGHSAKPDIPYSMADYADDAARLMQALGWDAAVVVGFSFGGMVAQELVLRHPARVNRLVLCATASGGAGGDSFPFHTLPPLSAAARAAYMIPFSDRRHDAAWIKANPLQMQMLTALAADPFADEDGRAQGARRQIEARRHHDSWARLPAIACPVLIAAGFYDGIAPPERQYAMAARIPGAKLEFFEGGHGFLWEDKAAFEAIIEFLS